MGECWEDLHLTCHSLETTAACTLMTAWWEHHTSPHCCEHFELCKVHLQIKVDAVRVLTLTHHMSTFTALCDDCVCVFYRTTPHTRCPPQTSMPACRLCPASTAAPLAARPSSPHHTPHPSTPQRELWVRYAMSLLPRKTNIWNPNMLECTLPKIRQMLGRLFLVMMTLSRLSLPQDILSTWIIPVVGKNQNVCNSYQRWNDTVCLTLSLWPISCSFCIVSLQLQPTEVTQLEVLRLEMHWGKRSPR